jgi:hypothetical protein
MTDDEERRWMEYREDSRRDMAAISDDRLWANYAGAAFYAQWHTDMMREELQKRGWLK